MCRFTTLLEYKANGDKCRTWCLCKEQEDATWECVRFWLENKLVPLTVEEAISNNQDLISKFKHQFLPNQSSKRPSVKDVHWWHAVTVSEFERCKRVLQNCVVLYADVVVNQLCAAGEIIMFVYGPYINDPPNLDYYICRKNPPPLIKYYNTIQDMRDKGKTEDQLLKLICDSTLHRFVHSSDYILLAQNPEKVTTYAHPSDFQSNNFKGLRNNCGEIFDFFPVIKRKSNVRKTAPLGIPRTQLEIVATEAEAEFVEWETPAPGSQEYPKPMYTRRIKTFS
jgi:hypothetical protein